MPQQEIPGFVRVVHGWTEEERWNAFLFRLGRFGAASRVPPGLYALGTPGEETPAIATASCRLTFDLLRRDLAGLSCWLLVLDTRGLDVGSAAAAGRFGTDELVNALGSSRLARVVSHRRIVVPGRAAGAIDADAVARAAGFEVLAGPSLSRDLPRFLSGGRPAGEPPLAVAEAAALVPAAMGRSLLKYPGFAFAVLLFAGLGPGGVRLDRAFTGSWPLLLLGIAAVLAGSGLAPVLYAAARRVPLWAAGGASALAAAAALMAGAGLSSLMDPFLRAGCWVFFPAAGAYLAQGFSAALPAPAAAPRRPAPALIALAILAAGLTAAALVLSKALEFRAG